VDFIACGVDSYIPTGPCVEEVRAAYEVQFMQPLERNSQYQTRFFEKLAAPGGYAALGYATHAASSCLNGNAFLDSDLCYSGVAKQDRIQCSKACFGEAGAVTEQTALTDTCEAPPPTAL
jgi:hypothetical protein